MDVDLEITITSKEKLIPITDVTPLHSSALDLMHSFRLLNSYPTKMVLVKRTELPVARPL